LNEIIFSSDSQLREISGFQQCRSLHRIEIPSSVEVIWKNSFSNCTLLRVVIIRARCQIRNNEGFRNLHPFIVYGNESSDADADADTNANANDNKDENVKNYRRQVHLGLGSRQVL
jgi:hypothetical protein